MNRVFQKRWMLLTACLVVFLTVLLAAPEAVQAATKNGLVVRKMTGKVYYYKNGKLLKNTWKNVTIKKKTYRYYFGKNGAAYKAPENLFGFYDVKIFTVGKKKYGFDTEGHLVKGGIYVDSNSRIRVFTSSGKYNEKKTKSLSKAFKTFDVTHEVSRNLLKKVKKSFGKPKKTEVSNSCKPWNTSDVFEDIKLIYAHYEVQLVHNKTTGEYALNGFFGC